MGLLAHELEMGDQAPEQGLWGRSAEMVFAHLPLPPPVDSFTCSCIQHMPCAGSCGGTGRAPAETPHHKGFGSGLRIGTISEDGYPQKHCIKLGFG